MDTEYKFDFEAVLDRIKRVMQFTTDAQAAEFIGMSPSGLGNRKRAGSIPFENICKACASHGVNIDWILTGNGLSRWADAIVATRTDPFDYNLMLEITRVVWSVFEKKGFAENEPAILQKAGVRAALSMLIFNRVASVKNLEERTAMIREEAEIIAYAVNLQAGSSVVSD